MRMKIIRRPIAYTKFIIDMRDTYCYHQYKENMFLMTAAITNNTTFWEFGADTFNIIVRNDISKWHSRLEN